MSIGHLKRGDGAVARGQQRAVSERMMQGVAQQTAAHRGGAGIHQRQQRRRGLAAQCFGEFKIAARGRVHAHMHALLLDDQGAHMRDRRALRRTGVVEHGVGCTQRQCQFRCAKARQIMHAKMAYQIAPCSVSFKLPRRHAFYRCAIAELLQRGDIRTISNEDFRGPQAFQFNRQIRGLRFKRG